MPAIERVAWPGWLREYPGLRERLDRIAAELARHAVSSDRYRSWSGSNQNDLMREAERLASQLIDIMRTLHERAFSQFADCGAKDRADEQLTADLGLDADELGQARVGYDPLAIQYPLLGLMAHMGAVRTAHRRGGRPEKAIERWALSSIARAASAAGVPGGRGGALPIRALVEAVFLTAGLPVPTEREIRKARKI